MNDSIQHSAASELSRRSLLAFCERLYPEFQAAAHLRYLADLLEKVERGEIRRLIVTLHPGSGKSTLLQAFCAWYLGRNGRRKVIETSAAAELAERNSRATRSYFTDEAWPFAAKLSADTSAQHRWNTSAGGGLMAVGATGTIVGFRGDLIVCDDLQNGPGSEGERATLYSWFREVLTPRLEPKGAIVIVQQRWGGDDLIARTLEAPDGKEWTVVRMPAIAEEDDVLGRAVGEPLWPERFGLDELARIKLEMGSRAFATQFQSSPSPVDGNLIKLSWFPRYTVAPTEFKRIITSIDCAAKTGIFNDYTAFVTVGLTQNAFYVLDILRRKMEYPDLVRMASNVFEQWRPNQILIEDASHGQALIQELKRGAHLPVKPIKAIGSKESRIEAATGTMEAGRVHLPQEAHWLNDFEREVAAFPNGKHDDMLDALCQVLNKEAHPKLAFVISVDMQADEPAQYGPATRSANIMRAMRGIF